MWISRKNYDAGWQALIEMQDRAASARAKAEVFESQNRMLQIQLDFMRVRLNQSEKERAQFLEKATGIHIPTPEIVPASSVTSAYGELPDFEDLGNEKAMELGIEHDSEGNIVYTK